MMPTSQGGANCGRSSSFTLKRWAPLGLVLAVVLQVLKSRAQPKEDLEAMAADPVSLVQTFHHISARSLSAEALKAEAGESLGRGLPLPPAAAAKGGVAAAAAALPARPTSPGAANATALRHSQAVHEGLAVCGLHYQPLDQQVRELSLEYLGYSPRHEPCLPDLAEPPSLLQDRRSRPSRGSVVASLLSLEVDTYMLIPILYAVVVGLIIARMLVNITWLQPEAARRSYKQRKNIYRPRRHLETETWNRSILGWLCIDWASEWIARWGDGSDSDPAITSDDLEAMGDPEDQPSLNYPRMQRLWDEEVAKSGIENARLSLVLWRFVGNWNVFKLVLWSAFFECSMYLGPPLAMMWVVQYFEWKSTQHMLGYDPPSSELAGPSVMAILIFTGLPTFMAVSNTVSAFMAQRIGMRATSSLSCLVFARAQCLPEKNHVSKKQEQDSDHETSDDDNAEEEDAPKIQDANGNYKGPEQFNLVQVVSDDVNKLLVLPLNLARLIVMLPVTLFIVGFIAAKIKWTAVILFIVNIFLVGVTMWTSIKQIQHSLGFFAAAGERLEFLEGVMFNIRTVKACGWTEVVRKKALDLRKVELKCLWWFYFFLGVMYNVAFAVPKMLIFIAIWVNMWLYPNETMENIFVLLPLLFTMQNAVNSIVSTLPTLVNIGPSMVRVGSFLRQTEAPAGRPRDEHLPDWITAWPKQEKKPSLAPMPEVAEEEGDEAEGGAPGPLPVVSAQPPRLRIQGSFKRREDSRPVLRDIDITMTPGESVAILGKVGSGKSTLLHGVLGELFPHGDARIEVPGSMCYSSQVPYIMEETLKENLLYGSPMEEERYNMAVWACSLLPDLEVLPGGDSVPIGSRGISLSGGQKARVSMARMAYASEEGGVVLMDDPFGAVDALTAKHILMNLVHGKILEGRTKLVACQPDAERLLVFDQLVVMDAGRVVERGTPEEVMGTEAYRALLSSSQAAQLGRDTENDPQGRPAVAPTASVMALPGSSQAFQLRDDEAHAGMKWESLDYFCSRGGWWSINGCIWIFCIYSTFEMWNKIVLQNWSTAQVENAALSVPMPSPLYYLGMFVMTYVVSMIFWNICWVCGMTFTLRMSEVCHKETTESLLNGSIDRFYDRTPVGRIMNRLSSDLLNLDLKTFNHITVMIGQLWQTIFPLGYIHILMPLYFTAMAIPWYYMMWLLIRRYWCTLVPMRYLVHCSKSHMDNLLTEVDTGALTVRAMQKGKFMMGRFQMLLEDLIKADMTSQLVLSRWLVNRLYIMAGFFVTAIVLLAMWIPGMISFGGLGLCLTNCFVLVTLIEMYIGTAAGAQIQFISMNRLFEYSNVPSEKASRVEGDERYRSFALNVKRDSIGTSRMEKTVTADGVIEITRTTGTGHSARTEVVLVQVPGEAAFAAPGHIGNLRHLCEDHEELKQTTSGHRIVAISGVRGDAEKMVEELLRVIGPTSSPWDKFVKLKIESDWLSYGAEVRVEELRVGYGDIPRDILRDVNFTIAPKSKVGIVGSTGCGKSTLMLSILRMLEPRGGRIIINGVDTTSIGLATLRQAIGMVPQDPVLLAGSLRSSIDPFEFFTDSEIWHGLHLVQMGDVVASMQWGLYQPLASEGGNLSYGQRQLLNLARAVVRQPSLILLDEATSALDPKTQELVQKTIETAFPDSTLIVIAHRLETILGFDQVLVMDKGDIIENGTPQELRDMKGGRFASMIASKKTW